MVVALCALMICACVAHAQSGWEARVTAAPNPLPAGKCASIVVEPVDDHGYRRTTLSNGEQIDRRKFTYTTSDAAHFTLRNDAVMWGNVCADTSAPAVTTIVTVTLPDGLKGTVQIFVVAKGGPPARAVVYRQQAPLRLPTSPEYAPGFVRAGVAARTSSANSGGAAGARASGGAADANSTTVGAGGAAGASADPTEPNATTVGAGVPAGGAASSVVHSVVATPRPIAGTVQKLLNPSESVTTSPLSLVGTYNVVSAIQTTPALSLTGTYHALSVVETTPVLSLTGTYHVVSGIATTPALSLVGTYGGNPVAGTAPRAVTPKPIPPGAHSP